MYISRTCTLWVLNGNENSTPTQIHWEKIRISYLYLFLMLDRRFIEMWSRGALPHLQKKQTSKNVLPLLLSVFRVSLKDRIGWQLKCQLQLYTYLGVIGQDTESHIAPNGLTPMTSFKVILDYCIENIKYTSTSQLSINLKYVAGIH